MFQRILFCTKSLSDQLQCTQMDLTKAADLILGRVSTLKEFRCDGQWNHLFKYANDVAKLHGIDVVLLRPSRRKQLPSRLQDGLSWSLLELHHLHSLNISKIIQC